MSRKLNENEKKTLMKWEDLSEEAKEEVCQAIASDPEALMAFFKAGMEILGRAEMEKIYAEQLKKDGGLQ